MRPEAFGAERLREAALAAWTQHPVRFREDANAEEDHARGYYRDRVVVELAQNAADAAARAGVPGHLGLRLVTSGERAVLVAANTGSPLDASGLSSLASLRASAKRDQGGAAVGRFGVGFAAVRSVADEVTVASVTGAVHFSVREAAEVLEEPGRRIAELGAEMVRRGRWLPVLRLPFDRPAAEHTDHLPVLGPDRWDTAVVLTLHDAEAVAQVRGQLALDDTLLLALPTLSRVTVQVDDEPPTVIEDVADRWVVATAGGTLTADLLERRPVEERDRTGWQVTWAVRRDGGSGGAAVVHAPTPTDEPCTLPALLIGTFPLDATRRHVAPGRLTDFLVDRAGAVWADLLAQCHEPDAPDPLDLLPSGLPAGGLDAALRSAVLDATRRAPLLTPAGGGPLRAPDDATVLVGPMAGDPAVVTALGAWWPALVVAPRQAHAVRLLEIATAELSELVDGLPDLSPPGAAELYSVFGSADPSTLEELAMVPVPLVDGRTARGPRGLVQLEPGAVEPDVLATLGRWGLRIVHPDAVHPLLGRLGADHGDAAGLLAHPLVRDRVLAEADETDDVAPQLEPTEVLLRLVGSALRAGGLQAQPWWGDVLLPADDGELVPAEGLTLAGSDAADWFDPDVLPRADPGLTERVGAPVLEALGVRGTVRLVAAGTPDLDGWDEYDDDVLDGAEPEDAVAVADLDAVRPEAWEAVLRALAQGPGRRALEPVRVREEDRIRTVPSYSAWWLRRNVGFKAPFALPGSERHHLSAVLSPAPDLLAGLDVAAQRWLGGVGAPEDLDLDGWIDLLAGFATGAAIPLPVAVACWRSIVEQVRAGQVGWDRVEALPALVAPDAAALIATDEVAVGTAMWAQHPAATPLLVVPVGALEAVADALDVERAQERAAGRVTSRGAPVETPDAVRAVFPRAPADWVEHDDLQVDGLSVDWWVSAGTVHAATTSGLGRGFAQVIGTRHAGRVERLLADPDAVGEMLIDLAGDDSGRGSAGGPS